MRAICQQIGNRFTQNKLLAQIDICYILYVLYYIYLTIVENVLKRLKRSKLLNIFFEDNCSRPSRPAPGSLLYPFFV